MHPIKKFLGGLLAAWALLTFAITFLIVLPIAMISHLIPNPRGQAYFIFVSRVWMWIWLHLCGCRIVIKGWENFKKGEEYVITFNHNSFLDVPISCTFVRGANKTIAKQSMAKIPIFGWYYSRGSVLVDRKSDESRKRSYLEMKEVLRTGMHMCIYPEGTRNRSTESMKAFHDGAFRLAVETGHSVMPAVIFNTKKALPADGFFFWPAKLELHFLPPIQPGNNVQYLKEKVRETMLEYFVRREG